MRPLNLSPGSPAFIKASEEAQVTKGHQLTLIKRSQSAPPTDPPSSQKTEALHLCGLTAQNQLTLVGSIQLVVLQQIPG